MSPAIRVVVADDQAILRSGLVALLRLEQGIDVVGEAADGAGTLEAVAAHRPCPDAVVGPPNATPTSSLRTTPRRCCTPPRAVIVPRCAL